MLFIFKEKLKKKLLKSEAKKATRFKLKKHTREWVEKCKRGVDEKNSLWYEVTTLALLLMK